jgi:hypothetical protein
MKLTLTSRLFLLTSSLVAFQAGTRQALAVPIPWIPVVDNAGTPALTQHPGPTPMLPYLSFAPPIMPQYDGLLLAYKARLRLGVTGSGTTITALNDEGVWGNGPEYSQSGTFSLNPTLIAQEGNATSTTAGAPTYGNAGTLTISNLQMSLRGDTVFQSNLSTGGKASLHDNCCLQVMALSGATAPFADLAPPVVDLWGPNVAGWFQRNPLAPNRTGIMRMTYPTGFLLPPCTPFAPSLLSITASSSAVGPMAAPGSVGAFLATPSPIGSPAISERGNVLFYAWDSILPTIKRQHLRLSVPSGGQAIINRRNDNILATDLHYPAGKLGVYSPRLVCVSDVGGAPSLAAWQMSSMINASNVTLNEPSLWMQRLTGLNQPECLVRQGLPAPGTGSTFNTFYEMQTVADAAGSGVHWVFFGTNLLSGRRAIYVMKVPAVGPFGPPTLIATDAGGTVLTPFVGVPGPITNLQPWFNVSVRGEVLFIANCGSFPVGARQVLCTASTATPAPTVRSQTSLGLMTLGGGGTITGFDLAKPDQGVFSRGQAINGLGNIAARILFRQQTTAGLVNYEGIFFAP